MVRRNVGLAESISPGEVRHPSSCHDAYACAGGFRPRCDRLAEVMATPDGGLGRHVRVDDDGDHGSFQTFFQHEVERDEEGVIENLVLAECRVEASVEKAVHEAVCQFGTPIQLDATAIELGHDRAAGKHSELGYQIQEVVVKMVKRDDHERVDMILLDTSGDRVVAVVHPGQLRRVLLLWLGEDLRRVRYTVAEGDPAFAADAGGAHTVACDSGYSGSPNEVDAMLTESRVAIALAMKAYCASPAVSGARPPARPRGQCTCTPALRAASWSRPPGGDAISTTRRSRSRAKASGGIALVDGTVLMMMSAAAIASARSS